MALFNSFVNFQFVSKYGLYVMIDWPKLKRHDLAPFVRVKRRQKRYYMLNSSILTARRVLSGGTINTCCRGI